MQIIKKAKRKTLGSSQDLNAWKAPPRLTKITPWICICRYTKRHRDSSWRQGKT